MTGWLAWPAGPLRLIYASGIATDGLCVRIVQTLALECRGRELEKKVPERVRRIR